MKIVKSAIRYKGEIYSGYNHEECFNELFKKHNKNSINSKDIEQGFITSENEFVNRIQATIIAETSGQLAINLKAGVAPLTSEDMHITWLHEKDKEIEQLEKENEFLKKQNSLMYQQGFEQGKFDKKMEQEYGKS